MGCVLTNITRKDEPIGRVAHDLQKHSLVGFIAKEPVQIGGATGVLF